MKKLIYFIALWFLLSVMVSAQNPDKNEIEKGVRALAEELNRSLGLRDINAYMACFGKPEGLLIIGEPMSLDSMRAIIPRTIWAKRQNEKWNIDLVQVIPLSNDYAFMQILFTGRYTYIPTGVTWEFKSGGFVTALVRNFSGKWKIVALHNSISGKPVPK